MDQQLKIVMGCDLAAFDFKMEILSILNERGYSISDVGCRSSKEGDYPIYGRLVGEKVARGEFDRGIVICGTGQGVCMSANKVKGVRAALCYEVLPALLSREHNNSNVLATGAWIIPPDQAVRVIEAWLFGKYSGGRHDLRLKQISDIENGVEVLPGS